MARYRLYLLTAVFCTVIVFGQSAEVTTPRASTVSITPSPKLESPEVPSETQDDSTSTAHDTSSISTSSATPETTITKDTTTTSTTTTPSTSTTPSTITTPPTTIIPPNTTVAPVTTTPAPGPLPPPQQGTWSFSENNSNVSCIVIQFAAQLDVTYTEMVNNSAQLKHIFLNVPAGANVTDGSCGNSSQWLTISWPLSNETAATNNLTLVYVTNSTSKTYALQQLNVTLSKDVFPNATSNVELSHGSDWQTPLATSYRCVPATPLTMASDLTGTVATLTVSCLQEEAFRTAPGKGFSAARECGSGDVPDAVPIAVGCALGALVLIVLVAYLVARRRSAARGYLSM